VECREGCNGGDKHALVEKNIEWRWLHVVKDAEVEQYKKDRGIETYHGMGVIPEGHHLLFQFSVNVGMAHDGFAPVLVLGLSWKVSVD
jgi:hypothetical protein